MKKVPISDFKTWEGKSKNVKFNLGVYIIWNICIDTSLWISGGITSGGENSEFIIIGEDGNITTIKGPDLPIPLFKHAMVSINNTLSMIIGGLSSDLFKESALTFWYDYG